MQLGRNKNKRKVLASLCCIIFWVYSPLATLAVPDLENDNLAGIESSEAVSSHNADEDLNQEPTEALDESIIPPHDKETETETEIETETETETENNEEESNSQKGQKEKTEKDDSSEYVEILTLLLEEDTDIAQVEDLLYEIDQDFNLTIIKDIDLIHIQSADPTEPIRQDDIVLNDKLKQAH